MKRTLITIVSLVALSGESFAQETKPSIRIVKDRGWNVCRSLVEELQSLPTMDRSIVCGDPLPLSAKKFPSPKWEELPVGEYLDVIYSIEAAIRMGPARKIPPIDVWRAAYQAQIKSGTIRPRLRQARVRFTSDGPEEMILAYMPNQDRIEHCRRDVAKGESVLAVGDYIFPYDPERRKATFIFPRSGSGASSKLPYHVRSHNTNAYLIWVSPLGRNASDLVVSRVLRRDPVREGMELSFYADQICNVNYHHVSPVAR